MEDLCWLSIAQAAALIRARKVSPVELLRAHLDRIARLDGKLRTYITVSADMAMKQAEEATAEIARGRYAGPLHGIPITYKDVIATAGIRTTAASRFYENWIPDRDANVVARLRRAGAITLGKATMNEFAFSPVSEDDFVPPARNPWNAKYGTGLSSSGSAAGVAAGLAMGSLGTDSGGSIRIPAAYCGVTGLKPTYGRVGNTGVIPLSYSLGHVGPLARTAEDAALLLGAIAGYDPSDASSSRASVPDYQKGLSRNIRGLRPGVCPRFMEAAGVETETWAAFHAALETLKSLGAGVVEADVPHLDYGPAAAFTILRIEAFHEHFRNLKDQRPRYGTGAFRQIAAGGLLSARDYLRAQQARRLIASELARAFESIDVLVTPTTPAPASGGEFTLGPADRKVAKSSVAYLAPFNLTGSPTISVPCGFTRGGMPIGIQLVGRAFEEERILGLAHQYQQATDWHRRRPPLEE